MEIKTNIENWNENAKKTQNKLIERLMVNLSPIAIINEKIYLEYIGDESKKKVFFEYYNNAKSDLTKYLSELYGISKIEGGKDLSKEKLKWLEEIINKFQPSHIEFSIKEN